MQITRARLADHHRPFIRVRRHDCRQRALRHTVLRPHTVDVRQRYQEVTHDLLTSRLVPGTRLTAHHVDARIVSEHVRYAVHARFVSRMAHKALDQHHVAFTAELLCQPARTDPRPFGLVDHHVDDTFSADLLVNRDDHDPLFDRLFQRDIQRSLVVRVDDDRVHAPVNQVLNLLNLPLHIDVGTFDDQVNLGAGLVELSDDILDALNHLRTPLTADKTVGNADGEAFLVYWRGADSQRDTEHHQNGY